MARTRRGRDLNAVQIALASASPRRSLGVLVALTAGCWLVVHQVGGSRHGLIGIFTVPVILSAFRFSQPAALGSAVAVAIVAGPLLPLDTDPFTPAPVHSWAARMIFFVVINQTVALLSQQGIGLVRETYRLHERERDLLAALERGEFVAVYQPIFELQTGRLCGAEALMRWERDGGVVLPADFIADAEVTGAIVPMTSAVLAAGTEQAVAWRRRSGAPVTMSVNLSARHLADGDLVDHVAAALRASGLPPEALQLEVTETAVINDLDRAITQLEALRAIGVTIALDDFGTGHSSLAYLHRFPVDVIKIDRQFVATITEPRAEAVAAAVVRLARSLGAATVAEGIETEDQADRLRALGCDRGQGYYYARPGPADRVERILAMAGPVRPTPQPD